MATKHEAVCGCELTEFSWAPREEADPAPSVLEVKEFVKANSESEFRTLAPKWVHPHPHLSGSVFLGI